MLQNCPICNLDLDLVTNKDAHVNNCLENNNDGRNLQFSGEFPPSPRERGDQRKEPVNYQAYPHYRPNEANPNRRQHNLRNSSDSSSEETIEEGDNLAGLYQYCDQTIQCVYPRCKHECNPMYFPTHALTEHTHEKTQNLICPLCKFYDPGYQYVPKSDSNLLNHLANSHSELIGIFDENEAEDYWLPKQREKERVPVIPKERREKEPAPPAPKLPVVVIEQATLVVPVTPHIEYYAMLDKQDSKDYLASVVVVDVPEVECIICLENFKCNDITARLLCMCLYHKPCIDRWWKNKDSRHCPLHTISDRT